MRKMVLCKVCNAPIAASAKMCPKCGAKNKSSAAGKVWIVLLVVLVIAVVGGTVGSNDTNNPGAASVMNSNVVSSSTASPFEGDCGISASAELGQSIIGFPELEISITNRTSKDIAAIQFYVIPCDVYGDEIKGWTSQNKLYTDTTIGAGKNTKITYQFIEDSIKTVKLYVYSVYFTDGTEWGDKDATKSIILSHSALIQVSGES